MVWRRLFPFKNNLTVCAVNFIFYWVFTYPHSLLHLQTLLIPFHFSTNIQLFHLLTKQKQQTTLLPWFFWIPKCKFLSILFLLSAYISKECYTCLFHFKIFIHRVLKSAFITLTEFDDPEVSWKNLITNSKACLQYST